MDGLKMGDEQHNHYYLASTTAPAVHAVQTSQSS